MNNNDLLIRIRYALDIKDIDMIEIFKLGGVKITKDELQKMLIKSKDETISKSKNNDDTAESDEIIMCNNLTLESFLNGVTIATPVPLNLFICILIIQLFWWFCL